ncbi:hypothetical protein KC343_g400 [Hortaea werneckii]|nr:hypothetical protein KC323_g6266 [Hortaea werneckii]KAI6864046.1 hypothetical protein KC338_g5627 [Hortaea werneckii]KAI7232655.1 hypothetical protein KC352_g15201 [Hortaea werneckii]KAI7351182.1 hypothetical protein KC320_g5093 [Hortaea werneckii]KAI7569382.1 hypothetical protein KC317_g3393 [Hortaea werneckii]
MDNVADQGSSREHQKTTDVLLMDLMSLALGWEFDGASEQRALVKRLYQAAQEERKAANSSFLCLREKLASYEKEIDSLRAKLANTEATTDDSQHSEIGKKTLDEVEKEGSSNGHWCGELPFKFCKHLDWRHKSFSGILKPSQASKDLPNTF